MKKTDPIQLAILIIVMLLGYSALQTFPYFLWLFYNWLAEGLTLADRFYNVTLNFLYLAFYIIGVAFLLKRSKNISQKIAGASSFNSDVNVVLKKNDILYVTLIALGSFVLMTKLPKLLVKIYFSIRENNKPFSFESPNLIMSGDTIAELIIAIVIATTMVVYAKTITEYLTKQIEEDDNFEEIGSGIEEN
jgi:hypothetical protein